MFGRLEFPDVRTECPICLETEKSMVKLPHCSHNICTECFKRCYYARDDTPEPPFPYPELEDDYYDNAESINWTAYPMLDVWKNMCEEISARNEERAERLRKMLAKCPLCRS
eukprot:335694-Hanusia_phi.AAC.2